MSSLHNLLILPNKEIREEGEVRNKNKNDTENKIMLVKKLQDSAIKDHNVVCNERHTALSLNEFTIVASKKVL